MKTFNKIVALGLVIIVFFSCTKRFEELDVNPNDPVDAPLGAVMTAAMVGMIQPLEGEDARLAGIWSRQFTGSAVQYAGFEVYNINSENFDWSGFYYSSRQQAIIAEAKAKEEANNFYVGVSKVIQAVMSGNCTALYGDIPFSEANNLQEFPDPNYDEQADVYAGVQVLLDEAISAFSSGTGSDVYEVDFFYSGDAAMWIAAANSLKARYYLHVGNYALALASAQQGIADPADDLLIPHGTSYNQDLNLYNSFGTQDRQGNMTANDAYLPRLLDMNAPESRDDSKTVEAERFATYYILDGDSLYDLNYDGYWAPAASFPIINAVETKLIIAECELRAGGGAGSALTSLNEVRAIWDMTYNIDSTSNARYDDYDLSDFGTGGIADNGQGSTDDNLLYEILEEKYISLVGQHEVFNDVRRTDNLLGLSPAQGALMPERFLYPQEEVDANSNTPRPIPGIFVPTDVNQ